MPAQSLVPVTPHATDNLPGGVCASLWVPEAGDVEVVAENDAAARTLGGVAAGTELQVAARAVRSAPAGTLACYSPSAPLFTGLLARYPLDDTADAGPYGLDLANNGGATFAAGEGASFTGSQSLTRAHDARLSPAGAFSVACKVRLASLTSSRAIVGKGSSAAGGANEWLLYYSATSARFRFFWTPTTGGTQTLNADALGTPLAGEFYALAAWYDPGAGRIFLQVNGGMQDSMAVNGPAKVTSDPLSIGAFGGVAGMDGTIRGVRLWGRVLTEGERGAL